jgi:predicted nucleic acid-binding protein
MPERRRVVPDCSAIVPAYFPEVLPNGFELSPRALTLNRALDAGTLIAFAPDLLIQEFTSVAFRKLREGKATRADTFAAIGKLVQLRIIWTPLDELLDDALHLMEHDEVSPADSCYLACARLHDAEYWLSHRHRDRIAERAAGIHDKLFLLSDHAFEAVQPGR